MPPPRKRIVWLRAAPIFILMMGVLLFGQQFVLVRYPTSPLAAGNGLVLSLVTGIVGAFLISRYATVTPPPPPSKSQQRKMAAASRAGDDEEDEGEEAVAPIRARSGRRRRRRRSARST